MKIQESTRRRTCCADSNVSSIDVDEIDASGIPGKLYTNILSKIGELQGTPVRDLTDSASDDVIWVLERNYIAVDSGRGFEYKSSIPEQRIFVCPITVYDFCIRKQSAPFLAIGVKTDKLALPASTGASAEMVANDLIAGRSQPYLIGIFVRPVRFYETSVNQVFTIGTFDADPDNPKVILYGHCVDTISPCFAEANAIR